VNSNEAFRNYRHDITGKFKDISMAINSLTEESLKDPLAFETFHAIHEVILKMLNTSQGLITKSLSQNIELIVTDCKPDPSLPNIQIEGLNIRYLSSQNKFSYIYSTHENEKISEEKIIFLKLLIPFKELRFELKHQFEKIERILK